MFRDFTQIFDKSELFGVRALTPCTEASATLVSDDKHLITSVLVMLLHNTITRKNSYKMFLSIKLCFKRYWRWNLSLLE